MCPAYRPPYHDHVVWPSMFITIPGMLLRQYGDRTTLEKTHPQMRKWMERMAKCMEPDGSLPCDMNLSIGQYGFIVLACDTEGNMIGLHPMK